MAKDKPRPAVNPHLDVERYEREVADDPLVRLVHGYVEDRPLWTGAISQVMVHAPGTVMLRSEAAALGVDDYVLVERRVESDEFISGPPQPVVGQSLGHGYRPVVDAQLFNQEPPA